MAKRKDDIRVPNLRFPGFTEGWVTQKFSKVGEFFKGTGISKDKLTENGNPCILYGELYTKYKNEVIKEVFSKTDINTKGLVSSKVNDIIIPSSGESAVDIATACCVNLNDVLLGGDLNIIRPYKDNGNFISYQLNGKRKFEIAKIAQGSSVTHLYNESLKKLDVKIPIDITEQNEIASLLSLIDDRIQTQSKIIEQLKSLIDGLGKKLFTQKIRFKDEQGNEFPDWEIKKLKDVCVEHQLKNRKNENNEVFSVAKHKGVINQIEHLGRSFSAKDIGHYKLIYPGDLVYTKSPTSDFPFGIIKQNRTGRIGVVSPLYCVFKPKTFALGYLIHEYFNSSINTFNYLNPLVQKGAKNTMNINNNDFLNGSGLLVPTTEHEQTSIMNFFESIYSKIEIERELIKHYKNQKQYLLRNLFI